MWVGATVDGQRWQLRRACYSRHSLSDAIQAQTPTWLDKLRTHPQQVAMARLTSFELGQIKAHLHHGLGPTAIAAIVQKADGANVSVQGVCDAKAKLEADPKWRPRSTSAIASTSRSG